MSVLVDQIASRVCDKLSGKSAWIDQSGAPFYDRSPLGRNKHIAAVRRRVRELPADKWGCARVGTRYLLSPDALAEELRHQMLPEPVKTRPRKPSPEESASKPDAAAFRAELRAKMGWR